jgi:hypothetical protein
VASTALKIARKNVRAFVFLASFSLLIAIFHHALFPKKMLHRWRVISPQMLACTQVAVFWMSLTDVADVVCLAFW